MGHVRRQHPNAVLTPAGRRRMVGCVLERGWTVEATAERFQVVGRSSAATGSSANEGNRRPRKIAANTNGRSDGRRTARRAPGGW